MNKRAIASTAAALAISATLAAYQRPGSARGTLAITNVTVIDAAGTPPRTRTVVVRNGVIAALSDPGARPPGGSTIVDGSGKFLIPGLWDMHVHLATRPEPHLAEELLLPLFLAHGVVGVRDMGGPLDRVLGLRDAVARGEVAGPRLLTPGPFVDGPGEPDPLFRRITSASEATAAVADLKKAGVDFIKVQAGVDPGAFAALAQAARTERIVLAGHVPVSVTTEDALAAGQRSIEHISPALVGDAGVLFSCSRRADELRAELRAIERERATAPADRIRQREAALRQDLVQSYDAEKAVALGRRFAANRTWLVPTLTWSNALRPLSADDTGMKPGMEFVPEALRTRWLESRAKYLQASTEESLRMTARVARTSGTALAAMHVAGAPILAGTDTFDAFVVPGASLHEELQSLVGAGLSPLEALQAATRNAADYRGVLAREGTIARGKRADLVLLDADPLQDISNTRRINAVIQDGRLLRADDLARLVKR